MSQDTTLAVSPQQIASSDSFTSAFSSEKSFESAQRMAKALVSSSLVPTTYQGIQNIGSTIIALEIAQRIQCSILMVMQNLHVINGRPSWSSQFIIAALNSCGRFSPLRFEMDGVGDQRQCIAWATDKANGERLDGPYISIEISKKEGWFQKSGSKWQTMPELMLRYRAASFFGKLYAPDVLMGMQTEEEAIDIGVAEVVNTPKRPSFGKPEALPEKITEVVEITPEPSAEIPLEEQPEEQESAPSPVPQKQAPARQERPSQPSATSVQDYDVWNLTLIDVTEKSGVTQAGKSWTLYTLDFAEGKRATTFDGKLADEAVNNIGGTVSAMVKPRKKQGQWDFVGFAKSEQGEPKQRDENGDFIF